MIVNNWQLAWRHLLKDKRFTLLNLFGLAIGLACTLLICCWIRDERNTDRFHRNEARLYQVLHNNPTGDGGIMTSEHTPSLLGAALIRQLPQIEQTAMVKTPDEDGEATGIVSFHGRSTRAVEYYVTPNFFDLFSFRILEGDPHKTLAGRSGILISDSLAQRLFNDRHCIGSTISWFRAGEYYQPYNGVFTIEGVFQKPPPASTMQFDILFPYALYPEKHPENINWQSNNPWTFVMLRDKADPAVADARVRDLLKTRFRSEGMDDKWAGTLFLQRFSDKYLNNRYVDGAPAGGRIEYLRLFSIIAAFILIIACINFMNLSTAQAARRMKEVGIKKVIGATKMALTRQYLAESMLLTGCAVMLSMVMVYFTLPAFRGTTGKALVFPFDATWLILAAAITLFTGLLAGAWPAFYLARFRPIEALKGKLTAAASEIFIRKGLVVFQFTISIVLIVAVLVIYRQSTLIHTRNLGYNKDNIVRINADGNLRQNLSAFLTEARSIHGIAEISDVEGDMLGNHSGGSGISWPGQRVDQSLEFSGLYVDYDYMETMGLQMKEGRMFSPRFGADSDGVIFNETAIASMGLKNPVGKMVKLWGHQCQIIGVVRDFHYESLYNKVGPFFFAWRSNNPNIVAKIAPSQTKEALTRLESLYKTYNPGLSFEYNFLDQEYDKLYTSENRPAVLSRYFAAIAILISCMGLFGLSAFTARQRQKETCIRKIVGASVPQLALLLSRDFFRLTIISLLVALPIATWAMHAWLQTFAYRIPLTADIYLLAIASILLVTLLTVSLQSFRAASTNPTQILRSAQ